MKKYLLIPALAITLVSAFAATASAALAQPILGPKAYPYYQYDGLQGTKGFGQVKPRTIYYGGDPTGLVCGIQWQSWGGRVAHGTGIGWYVSPTEYVAAGHAAVVNITASSLGQWHGRSAYNHLNWSFPANGQYRAPHFC